MLVSWWQDVGLLFWRRGSEAVPGDLPFGPVQVVASSPAETQSRNPGLQWMCAQMGLRRACWGGWPALFIDPPELPVLFSNFKLREEVKVLYELTMLGGSLTSKVTAQGNLSQILILSGGLWKQYLFVIYAKWGKGHVWQEKLCNKLKDVEQLMSAGWWKLT